MDQLLSNKYEVLADMVENLNYKKCDGVFMKREHWLWGAKQYCALGGVAKNLGDTENFLGFNEDPYTVIARFLDYKKIEYHKCPKCQKPLPFLGMVAHLNNVHCETWSEIAEQVRLLQNHRAKNPSKLKMFVNRISGQRKIC